MTSRGGNTGGNFTDNTGAKLILNTGGNWPDGRASHLQNPALPLRRHRRVFFDLRSLAQYSAWL